MKPIRKLRIATIIATGRRFVVDRLSFPSNGQPGKCYCYGDIVEIRSTSNGGAAFTYSGHRTFLIDAVKIEEVEFTYQYASQLFNECANIRAAEQGMATSTYTSGRKHRTRVTQFVAVSTDELLRRAAAAEEAGQIELAAKLLAAAEAQEAEWEAERASA